MHPLSKRPLRFFKQSFNIICNLTAREISDRESNVLFSVITKLPFKKLRIIKNLSSYAFCLRVEGLLSEKELMELPCDGSNIFKKSNNDCYMEKTSARFCNGKYSVLSDFCYVELLLYYTLENISDKNCEYQPDELDDNLIENNHEECSYLP